MASASSPELSLRPMSTRCELVVNSVISSRAWSSAGWKRIRLVADSRGGVGHHAPVVRVLEGLAYFISNLNCGSMPLRAMNSMAAPTTTGLFGSTITPGLWPFSSWYGYQLPA